MISNEVKQQILKLRSMLKENAPEFYNFYKSYKLARINHDKTDLSAIDVVEGGNPEKNA